ncbi:TetR/AcrR family transcriptional regulator [Erysipelothrix sp. HDW6B]|uniref:TetR/AcrR family transcriptional regulator n=1 Tax=Erysipelothrix TaxID=1647 RepID=UPI001356F000|nr:MULTISPECIES: TetR/AcrR family transcriptional regulator [Erysipelothrix]QIK85390.1 TetR/AcrR family transcriptional regulator [Erysipelothrix sp. HDW6B]
MAEHKLPEVRKKEIVAKAYELFTEYGVDKTSITQIAKAVGVAKGLLYYYFKSKDEILDAVVDSLCEEQVSILSQRLSNHGHDVLDKILILLDTFYEIHPYYGLRPIHPNQEDAYLITSFHERYLKFAEKIVEQIIEEGQAQGYFQIQHPKLMFVVTLEGIYGLTKVYPISKREITDLVEQSLAIPHNALYERSAEVLTSFS